MPPLLNDIGFASKMESDQIGVASAVKMCRSVMIKGLEAMVIESLTVDTGIFGIKGGTAFARSADWRTEADRILAAIKEK
jgi:3-hydroxyisobutyrate dehydrogenase-like beta-hydroxyacid dehydrogenase